MRLILPLFLFLLFYSGNPLDEPSSFNLCEQIEVKDNVMFAWPSDGNSSEKHIVHSGIKTSTGILEKVGKNCFAGLAGIYGYDYLNKKQVCYINFEDGYICSLKESEAMYLAENGFSEVDSNFKINSFSISILIKRRKFDFKFDTGFEGTFALPYKSNIPFLKDSHAVLECLETSSTKPEHYIERSYSRKSIGFNGIYYGSAITVSQGLKLPKVGMGFLKGFNWIIDFKNNKIYARKNSKSIDTFPDNNEYTCNAIDDKLIIIKKRAQRDDYSLGAEIKSVNNLLVTRENLCEMLDLLHTTSDWKSLQLTVSNLNNAK